VAFRSSLILTPLLSFLFIAEIKSAKSPFLFLAIDLPPPPLFQDAVEGKNIIPQVSIYSVLAKYDGSTAQESVGQLKRYKCQRLPPYIILHFKRFTKNFFVEEKNPTIINFPLKGLDFRECKLVFSCRTFDVSDVS
jgi:U4/U6.U5 tri-snRNP-associated protein 2